MAYRAVDIAKHIISFEYDHSRFVSNLRLQKLLYFVQAKCLIELSEPCFIDPIEAWDYGPVVPNVYHIYKIFGGSELPHPEIVPTIEKKFTDKIDDIVDEFAGLSVTQLVNITHGQTPWIEAHKNKSNNIITNDSIIKFFSNIQNA